MHNITLAYSKPHRVRGWLDAKPDPQFAEKCHDICQTYRYRLAPENAASRQAFLSDPEHPSGFHFTPKHAIGDFINYFNETMAKPFRWTYQDTPPTV